jgi:L-ascorbate metabolism protein UlaG (beta-lactamase superfamily)
MKFTILSHACLYVEQGDIALAINPWLRGSTYWRSWWNYPPAAIRKRARYLASRQLVPAATPA